MVFVEAMIYIYIYNSLTREEQWRGRRKAEGRKGVTQGLSSDESVSSDVLEWETPDAHQGR